MMSLSEIKDDEEVFMKENIIEGFKHQFFRLFKKKTNGKFFFWSDGVLESILYKYFKNESKYRVMILILIKSPYSKRS